MTDEFQEMEERIANTVSEVAGDAIAPGQEWIAQLFSTSLDETEARLVGRIDKLEERLTAAEAVKIGNLERRIDGLTDELRKVKTHVGIS